ncbi:thioesterase [Azorhizobium oxalatiphilum]|uniref:Thioesterase n=1 Tax=Azorhizobium oxalatiphilum TaxID=980631 RepID=A0A917CAK0_9HYPH|nr:thioesterase family protein [Azorhizobium oxalatiphilum]GGF75641.1 thioesterase [Azorhizobium oxalatiphilum]
MLDVTDFEPVFFAPFVSSAMAVERDWTDANGHLNAAYYSLIFDNAFNEALALIGFGPHAIKRRTTAFFTAETHTRYLRELSSGVPVRVTLRLEDYDDKRLHIFETLHHGSEGWVAATCEQVALHVDLASRRAAAIPDSVLERISDMRQVHATLPPAEGIGRSVVMGGRC